MRLLHWQSQLTYVDAACIIIGSMMNMFIGRWSVTKIPRSQASLYILRGSIKSSTLLFVAVFNAIVLWRVANTWIVTSAVEIVILSARMIAADANPYQEEMLWRTIRSRAGALYLFPSDPRTAGGAACAPGFPQSDHWKTTASATRLA